MKSAKPLILIPASVQDQERKRFALAQTYIKAVIAAGGVPILAPVALPATVARAQLALDRFDESKRIGQLLEQTGYGNNPDVLRFFNRLADALMEDGLVQGQAGGSMPPLEERMYAGWSSRSGSI